MKAIYAIVRETHNAKQAKSNQIDIVMIHSHLLFIFIFHKAEQNVKDMY